MAMKKLILLVCTVFLLQISYSQTNIAEFLKAGEADANALIKAYLDPAAMTLGDAMNNGWYNSAATHKLYGFDFNLSVSAVQIPTHAKTFDISTLGLTNMTVVSGGNISPTAAGADVPGPLIQVKDNSGKIIGTFNMLNGYDLDIIPVPMVQVGFGVLRHTDLIVRYIPDLTYSNNGTAMKLGSWGLGMKHNFMEWVPFLKDLHFDASIFGSYSQVNEQNDISFTPEDYELDDVIVTFTNDESQYMKVKAKTTKFGLIVSKKFGVLTIYGGIGQSTSQSNLDMIGKYPVITEEENGDFYITNEDALIDPISIKYTSKNLSMDAGLKLQFGFFAIFGSLNKAEYTSYNAGVSFGTK